MRDGEGGGGGGGWGVQWALAIPRGTLDSCQNLKGHEMRDWQTSSLHMRHNYLLNKDGNALSVVIFGTESVNTKAFVETSS